MIVRHKEEAAEPTRGPQPEQARGNDAQDSTSAFTLLTGEYHVVVLQGRDPSVVPALDRRRRPRRK